MVEIKSLFHPLNISIPGGWRWAPLEEVCKGIYDCPHSTPTLAPAGPLMARSQDIRSGVFLVDQAASVSEETYQERIRRAEPAYGDLLYSREGTYFGIAAEVPGGTRVCLGQRMVLLRPDERAINFRYLRYWLNSPVLAGHVHGQRDGSVAERLNLPTIRRLPVPVPPLERQLAVAALLGALDDKIDLNRRLNETLEAITRATFKSWFVDFEPVREGHPTFPRSFTSSLHGQLPCGWRIDSLLEQASLLSGGTPDTSEPEYWGGDIAWASAGDVSQCREPFLIETSRSITSMGLERSSTRIIPARATVVVARGATTGRSVMLGEAMAMNQTCYALHSKLGADFALFCQVRNVIGDLVHAAHGSVFDTITTRTFVTYQAILPEPRAILAFEEKTGPLFERILNNQRESRTLAALRDTLLPKLLSGEIRVKQAERMVGEAV